MEEKKLQRPLIIEMDDTRKELIQCVNNAIDNRRLPFYLIEMIFADVYTQIKVGAQNELAQARAQIEADNFASSK